MTHQGNSSVSPTYMTAFAHVDFAEIMDILRVKKAQLPVPPTTATKKQKTISSAATIIDEDLPEAGSSTGPGTLRDVVS